MSCPFCRLDPSQPVATSDYSFAFRDRYPISPGHTLIVPRRHVESFFELDTNERHDLLVLMDRCKAQLDLEFNPDGFNFGLNDGRAAGQTVMHVHLHLIPRYKGDVADPRGGVRWILPEHAIYWDRDE